ncbi:MAG: hypothetical protein AAF743_04475 [Planctomycetota bacterium]
MNPLKTAILPAACTAALLVTVSGCAKTDAEPTELSPAPVSTPEADDTMLAPYPDYATVVVDDVSYIAADSASLAPLKEGVMPPADKMKKMADADGNVFVFIDTGAVTAADLIAGFKMNNPDKMLK